jgi:hypothetical protein
VAVGSAALVAMVSRYLRGDRKPPSG